jgi:PKD repeat protein
MKKFKSFEKIGIVIIGLLVCFSVLAILPQVSATLTSNEGDGWADIDMDWFAKTRHGGAGGFRASVGIDPTTTSGQDGWFPGGWKWASGTSYHFLLDYDATNEIADLYVTGQNGGNPLCSYNVGPSQGAIGINARTAPEAGMTTTIENVEFNSVTVSPDSSVIATSLSGESAVRHLLIQDADLSNDFTLEGDFTFVYGTSTSDERPSMVIDIGLTSCVPICRNVEDNIEFCTIQEAIDAATTDDGETIEVYPGTFQENAASYCDINLNKDVSLIGAGSGSTIIELTEGKSEGLQINGANPSDITIEGITFTYQSGSTNAAKRAIRVFSDLNSLTLCDVVVEYAEVNNVEINGDINNLIIEDCNFHHAGSNGLMCPADIGSGSITNSHFDNNGRLDDWASGMHLFGLTSNIDIIGCTMSYNKDSGFNGRQLSNIYFEDITASYNTHTNGGGGICISEKVGSSTDIEMLDVTAEYNGRDGILVWTWYDYCSISDVTITGGLFTNNGWAGIRVLNWPASGSTGGIVDNVIITQAQIMNNPSMGVWFELDYGSSAATSSYVNYNNIVGNSNYGVLNSGDGVLDAKCNWWGDISGPSSAGPGIGDPVSSNVIYCPWLDDVYPDGDCLGGAVCWNVNTGEYFCSIQKAIDDSDTDDGDTIEVFAGTHPGNIIVYKELTIESKDGAALTIINANDIDYSGYKNSYGKGINYAWAETNDPGLLQNGFMIWSDYVTIDGFTIINAAWPSQYNRGIGILIGSIHTTYAGFIPWNIDQWGGIIPNPDEPTPTGVVIKNNIIDGASDGIYNWASNGNTFEYNTVNNSVALGGVGIQCYEGGTNNIIRYNTVDNVDGSAISICGAWPDLLLDVSNTEIYENLVTNNNWGIQYYNMYGSNVNAYNNNILNNNRGVVVEGVGGALVGHANYNNILGNNEGIVNTAPDGIFDAECNWYGHSLGPTHLSNPLGVGDSVSDNVDYLPWLNLPFEDPNSICGAGLCQDIVYIDDDYTTSTVGWYIDHFISKQMALERLELYGMAYVFPGIYMGDIIIDDFPCDNTGITQMGEYGCFPVGPSAVIRGSETIKVNDVTIKYLEYTPNVDGAIIVDQGISGTTIRCNKFVKDCVQHAIGVLSYTDEPVNAELNWWGVPDGPSGGKMDDGKTANGFGVKVIGNNVDVEPWIGIHAEIAEPSSTIEVEVGTSVQFDAEGSWAYTYGECCQEPELLPMQYLWDFGDGYYSANKVASHTFDNPGSYKVSIRVDSPGIPGLYPNFMYDWDYVIVHVVTPDTPLTANADGGNLGGYETIVGEPIYFHGDAYGGDGNYVFSWDFGDNKGTSNEQNPTYVYDKEGKYTATLTVYSDGETATDTADVTVLGIDELIVDLTDTSTVTGTETWFTASVSGGKKPYSYLWEFGDGETSTDANPSHVYDSVGKYTVSLTVTDSNDKVRSDVATVDVAEGKTIEPVEIKDVQCSIGSVKAIINTGSYPVDWSIDVEGGFVMLGGYSSGSLPEKSEMTVETPFTFGFGNVEITVTANELTEKHSAFLLGPFFLGVKEI